MQEYGSQGPGARLPDLLVGRENHACGFYVNKEGKMVGVNKLSLLSVRNNQIFIFRCY